MLFLIGMLIQEHQDPRKSSRRHRPPVVVDPIDVTLVWIIKICLVVLYLTVPQLVVDATESGTATTQPDESFFFLCSGGQVKQLHDHLIQNPEWVHAKTENGETCLHLAGIRGHSSVTQLLLEKGADPDVRSDYALGLRMHPLSWNVYGGHADNVELLLKYGATVNADFDSMDKSQGPVTAMDITLQLKSSGEDGEDERFVQIESILRKYGGKTIHEVQNEGTITEDTDDKETKNL